MLGNLFGTELEHLRRVLNEKSDKKITQKEIAEKIGVTTQAYQNWIHGRRGKDIDLETIEKISKVLKGDFKKLVRFARPDLLKYLHKLCPEGLERQRAPSLEKGKIPEDVIFLTETLYQLYVHEPVEFEKIKRIISDFYPEFAARSKRSVDKKR